MCKTNCPRVRREEPNAKNKISFLLDENSFVLVVLYNLHIYLYYDNKNLPITIAPDPSKHKTYIILSWIFMFNNKKFDFELEYLDFIWNVFCIMKNKSPQFSEYIIYTKQISLKAQLRESVWPKWALTQRKVDNSSIDILLNVKRDRLILMIPIHRKKAF